MVKVRLLRSDFVLVKGMGEEEIGTFNISSIHYSF